MHPSKELKMKTLADNNIRNANIVTKPRVIHVNIPTDGSGAGDKKKDESKDDANDSLIIHLENQ